MKSKVAFAIAFLGAVLWVTSPVLGQEQPKGGDEHPKGGEHPKGEHPKGGEHPQGGEHPGADAWAKAAAPGPEHQLLAQLAGSWTTTCKFTMDPTKPPQESKGTCEKAMILGGRFLRQEYKGDFQGTPFEGIGIWGYDNLKKTYVSVWMDSMGTMIVQAQGTYDPATKTFTEVSEVEGPGGKTRQRYVTKTVSDKEHRFEIYESGAEGKERMIGEITYTRK